MKPHVPLLVLAGAIVACACAPSQAQSLYRSVGPDGRVTYSDRATVEPKAEARPANGATTATGLPAGALPHTLREAVERFPVRLYTGRDCTPCTAARDLLVRRGVPFSERTVTSRDDVATLKTLSGAQSLPFATIGGQHLKGYAEAEWLQYLDAAGYPRRSALPPGWRPPEPTPLVAITNVAEPAAAPAGDRPEGTGRRAPVAKPAAGPSNPAGISF